MITPEEIRRKAANCYSSFVKAWLAGETFFPYIIRGNRSLKADDHAGAISVVQNLRDGSKAVIGKGYSVEWVERMSRHHGRNQFPQSIRIDSEVDFLWLAGKQDEFARFARAVGQLRMEFPELSGWIASHVAKVTDLAHDIEGLVAVLHYFKTHPRPGMFARELPLPVPTKFIEWHQNVLREWFDLVLPPSSISAAEAHFERRYGLRYPQPHLLLRTLDESVRVHLGLPGDELSLPVDTLAKLQISEMRIFIVENKVNALTLPDMRRTVVLGGLGDGVTLLRYVPWLSGCEVIYWGDLDAEGFETLSSLRVLFPGTRSMFMDICTLESWKELSCLGTGVRGAKPLLLSVDERVAYQECCLKNIRIEQERLPQDAVYQAMQEAGYSPV